MVKGLDNWITTCRIEQPGIDPQIVIEARNGRLFLLLGNFNCTQARQLADLINKTCDDAEGMFANQEIRK